MAAWNSERYWHMERGTAHTGTRRRSAAAAAELDALGYWALWVPDVGGDVFGAVDTCWRRPPGRPSPPGSSISGCTAPTETADAHARLTASHGDRFLVGIGVQPLDADRLQGTGPVPSAVGRHDGLSRRAGWGHHSVGCRPSGAGCPGAEDAQLARTRAAGSHPYNVTPAHTALAREAVGPSAAGAARAGGGADHRS